MTNPAKIGRCLDCNYALQGLSENRCPECRRVFDPANARTMNMGRPVGPIARAMLQPIGFPTLLLALVALGMMLAVTRQPLGPPSLVEVRRYFHSPYWQTLREAGTGWRERVLEAGIGLTVVAAAVYLTRAILMLAATIGYRRYRPYRRRRYFRHLLIVSSIAIAMIGVVAGWPVRIGRAWVDEEMAKPSAQVNSRFRQVYSQSVIVTRFGHSLTDEQQVAAIAAAARQLTTPELRMTALSLLVTVYPKAVPTVLADLAPAEKDEQVCEAELHLLAMTHDERGAAVFERLLSDPRSGVRAAAADGLAIRFGQAFQLDDNGSDDEVDGWRHVKWPVMMTKPAIVLNDFIVEHQTPIPSNSAQRDALIRMMLQGTSPDEREAAARALVMAPPPNYQLRVAEWGVWISDHGHLKLVQSVLDEIPPFVHQTANPMSDFSDRVNSIMFVTKPIVHITVNEPMAVDLAVLIRSGRPWYAYPGPDDFSLSIQQFQWTRRSSGTEPDSGNGPLTELDKKGLGSLSNPREGYPWLFPYYRRFGPYIGAGHNAIDSLGLRWQSLIVSPQKLPWMSPPDCGPDVKYAWWNVLRQVPSSWVSSRGEADRFIYYDGPTLADTPAKVALDGERISIEVHDFLQQWRPLLGQDSPRPFSLWQSLWAMPQNAARERGERTGLYIEVSNGQPSARRLPITKTESIDLKQIPAKTGPAAVEALRKMLLESGLTDAEAGGLIASWKHQFFETDGKRFLLMLSPEDYDVLCPIQVRPKPTEMFRVGIVLTEF